MSLLVTHAAGHSFGVSHASQQTVMRHERLAPKCQISCVNMILRPATDLYDTHINNNRDLAVDKIVSEMHTSVTES